ncbi:MAG: copper resistance protein NlpE [Prevotella sp.]|nr:copper resistance protein NlpE [Prevotella sp.]
MKRTVMILTACAILAACQQQNKTAVSQEGNDTTATDSLHFVGELPAADGPGIRYDLRIANDSTAGFAMTETYLEAEKGKDQTTAYAGKAETVTKTIDGKEVKAYKLASGVNEPATYFKMVNDSTLRMVNEDLEEAVSGLSYDLKLQR